MRMVIDEVLAGRSLRALRLCSNFDDLGEVLADFAAVGLDRLGRIRLQQLPEFRVGPSFRMNPAPILIGDCDHWSVSFDRGG